MSEAEGEITKHHSNTPIIDSSRIRGLTLPLTLTLSFILFLYLSFFCFYKKAFGFYVKHITQMRFRRKKTGAENRSRLWIKYDYFTMLATSAAKSSCLFSMPSPFSKRMNFLIAIEPPSFLAVASVYLPTVMELSFTNS